MKTARVRDEGKTKTVFVFALILFFVVVDLSRTENRP
jgi:hypothetical protein